MYESYSDADLALGFDALRMTVGTVARLAGATVDPPGAAARVSGAWPRHRVVWIVGTGRWPL